MSEAEPSGVITRKDLEAKIVARAWTDDAFRRKFLADPKGQFEEHLGTKLPETLVMTAYQEDANHLHFVIPARPAVDLDELSDEDLEKVAGGVELVTSVSVLLVTLGASALATALGSISVSFGSLMASVCFGGWGVNK